MTSSTSFLEKRINARRATNLNLSFAVQGQEGWQMVQQALDAGKPYALAFVDVRMPPGWDGIDTIKRIWDINPEIQMVICTAYSDYSWEEITRRVGKSDRLIILKKPFDNIEVLQLAHALTEKWFLSQQVAGLRQNQKMEALGQLAAGVAHDFNNLLTVVHGHLAMIQAKSDREDESIRQAADKAAQVCMRGGDLTRQLLTFGRKQTMKLEPQNLNHLVEGAVEMLGRMLPESIQIEMKQAEGLPIVQADAGMIGQIVVNLGVNARDAMPDGGRLRIQTGSRYFDAHDAHQNSEISPGPYAFFEVADTGVGIKADCVDRIFDPFYTTKESGKGTGLGLATCHGIVKQHQGWIQAVSRLERGTTFRVFLPARDATPAPQSMGEESKTSIEVRGGKEHILVVEDEPTLRELLSQLLKEFGYHVLEAAQGREALRLAKQVGNRINLLLTDMIMPEGITGWKLAELLHSSQPDMKVIYTSGYSRDLFDSDLQLQEDVNFLAKPFQANKLVQIIRHNLDGAQPRLSAAV